MIQVDARIWCDGCGKEEPAKLAVDWIAPVWSGTEKIPFLNIHTWRLDGFAEWGSFPMERKNGGWFSGVFCPECYRVKLASVPKKEGIFKKLKNVFK